MTTVPADSNGNLLYRFLDNVALLGRSDNQNLALYSSITGRTRLVSTLEIRLLRGCLKKFATLDEHAARLCNEFGFGAAHFKATRKMLGELAQCGLLTTRETFADSCRGAYRAEETVLPRISSLAVPTRNRPELLGRCLESFAGCGRSFERHDCFVIADQSSSEGMRNANLEILQRVRQQFGIDCYYAGPEQLEQFAGQLSQHADVEEEIVRFAMLSDDERLICSGANRNALLLCTAGDFTLQVDDDTQSRVAPMPESGPGLSFTSKYFPADWYFLSQKDNQMVEETALPVDVFALHEELLGKPIGQLMEKQGTAQIDFDGCIAKFSAQLEPHQVKVTALGVAGDDTTGNPFVFLLSSPQAHAELVSSEETYRAAMTNQSGILRGVKRATIGDGAWCSGLNLGMDNRILIPPFMPVQRKEDGIFAALFHHLRQGYFGFLPGLLLHRQGVKRSYSTLDLLRGASSVTLGDIVVMLVETFYPHPYRSMGADNLVAIGQALSQWGRVSQPDFEYMLKSRLMERASLRMLKLEELLRAYQGRPDYWGQDMRACLKELHKSVCSSDYIIAGDLQQAVGRAQAGPLLQSLVRRLGDLLQVWPHLCQTARALRAKGVSGAVPVK